MPQVRTVVKQDNWKVDGVGNHTTVGYSDKSGSWLLRLNCDDDGLVAWLWITFGNVSTSGDFRDQVFLADFDGDSREQT